MNPPRTRGPSSHLDWRNPDTWVLFTGLSLCVPCLFFCGIFPTFYPLALMIAALPARLGQGHGTATGVALLIGIILVQALCYAALFLFVASKGARWLERSRAWAPRLVIAVGVSTLLLATWLLPVWGSRGFVDPHPLQTMMQLVHRFPNPGL